MIEVDDNNFDEFIKEGTSLLKIGSEWCGPCKTIAPIVESISTEYSNAKFGMMDADSSPQTMQKLQVRNIPTILIYKNGFVVDKHVGMATKAQLKGLIDKHV